MNTAKKTHVIMVYGAPGSGKTFFAEKFSSIFKAPYIDLNSLRYQVIKKPTFSAEEDKLVKKVGLVFLKNLLKCGQTIILEGPYNTSKDRQAIRKVLGENGYKALLVWVQTDIDTTKKRVAQKTGSEKLTKKQFDILVDRLEAPTRQENPIVISGKHTFQTQMKVVLSQLSNK